MASKGKPKIDVEAAEALLAKGLSMTEIGRALAAMIGRNAPFCATSISTALRKARRERRERGKPAA